LNELELEGPSARAADGSIRITALPGKHPLPKRTLALTALVVRLRR
jgi:hypothetical protein